MSHVLLLRAPSDASTTTTAAAAGGDPYETQLTQAAGATTTSIPVYETVLTLDELQWILETGPAFHGYKGVIVTSKRAVDAWAKAALNVPPPVDERAHWTDIPFYTIGNSTASGVRSLSTTLSSAAHLAPTQVLGAEETGTAEQLAHFILAQLASQRERESGSLLLAPPTPSSSYGNGSTGAGSASSTSLTLTGSVSTDNLSVFTSLDSPTHAASNPSAQAPGQGETKSPQTPVSPTPSHRPTARARARSLRKPTKLLFLVGDKTRDVLPSLLSADAHIELDSVQVYTAKPSPSFPNALRNAVLARPKVKDWWIAVFAPSGADYALPYLREHFSLLPSSSSSSTTKDKKRFKKNKGPPVARLAAIGPTTAAHLREVLKLDVAAEAKKPNPEALVEAIRSVGK